MMGVLRKAAVLFAVALALVAVAGATRAADYPVPVPHPVATGDLLVGSYYFPGHFNAARWVPMARAGFPYPLLGYYRDGEPEVSDWHIKWAVEHGISFFAFDWYYDYKTGNVHEHNKALNDGFLHAKYRDLMKFCIFWCNEEPGEADYTEEQMMLLARTLRDRYLKQPNYLRFDGKAALFISQPQRLIKRFTAPGLAKIWQKMGAEAGVQLYPIAEQQSDEVTLAQAGFCACAAYNYAGVNVPAGKQEAPYDTMVTGYEDLWKQGTKDAKLPFIVPVSPGWDSRPWYGDKAMVRTDPRPEKFRRMCEAARKYVDPKLRVIISECWNEFGEGSYIEPTTQYGFGYLDAMRDAFCPNSPHHVDNTPQSLGHNPPVYDEIPVFTEADIAAQDGNLIYNPGFEKKWGWVYYRGSDVQSDETVAHAGKHSGLLRTTDGGMKCVNTIAVKPGDKLHIWAWVRTDAGVTAELKCALFGSPTGWLGRYYEVGSATGQTWQKIEKTVTWEDAQASFVDLEIATRGGTVWVDDVGVKRE